MILLFRTAIRHGRRVALLGVTLAFMALLTFASQAEMLSLGVLTKSGADFFQLFAPEKDGRVEAADSISLNEVEERWHLVDREGKGTITKAEATQFMASRKDRNPINRIMNWVGGRSTWLQNLKALAIFLVVVAIVKGIAMFGSNFSRQMILIRVRRDLRQHYFEHIQTLSLDFYNKYNVGSLSSRVSGDCEAIANGIYAALFTYLQVPFAVLSSLAICFMVSVKLSLLMFIGFPIIIMPMLYFAKKVKAISRQSLALQETYSSVLLDALSGIHTIKLFAMEKFTRKKFKEQNDALASLQGRAAGYGTLARPVLHVASTGLLAGVILYGIYFAALSVPEVLVFCGLVFLMYEPIKKLNDENLVIQRGVASAERLNEVLSLKPDIADRPDAIEFQDLEDVIEFDNVWFRYLDEWVLKGVSFKVKRGEVVALVGPTGTGKSTLAQLLPRLYEPQKGEIRINGKPLATYTQQSLREAIAFVPQKPFFFLDTVSENIAFGCDFPREEIELAARRAHADEFIQNMPQKYDTPLNEGGKNLSGGQAQRMAISRALLKKAPILVMDEATSSLDAVSENHIKEAVNELRGEVTQILIAHRLSTIQDADRIVYLEEGESIAQGTKDELLETCPQFRRAWEIMQGPVPA